MSTHHALQFGLGLKEEEELPLEFGMKTLKRDLCSVQSLRMAFLKDLHAIINT